MQLTDLRHNFDPARFACFVGLYLKAFPNFDEREDPSIWPSQLQSEPSADQPVFHILLAISERDTIQGAVVYEYYQNTSAGLLTYLLVADETRGQGLARRLIDAARLGLHHEAELHGRRLTGIFAEAEDPEKYNAGPTEFDPTLRRQIFGRLGAANTGVPYVQPKLTSGSERCRHLDLLCFPLKSGRPAEVDPITTIQFLHEFYCGLGVTNPEADIDWRLMSDHLHQQ
ncbi:unnamed protein product, partial [Ectocarpus sp. 8 AP-2014]